MGLKAVEVDQMTSKACDGVGIGRTKLATGGLGLSLVAKLKPGIKKSLTLAALALGMVQLGRDILRAKKPAVDHPMRAPRNPPMGEDQKLKKKLAREYEPSRKNQEPLEGRGKGLEKEPLGDHGPFEGRSRSLVGCHGKILKTSLEGEKTGAKAAGDVGEADERYRLKPLRVEPTSTPAMSSGAPWDDGEFSCPPHRTSDAWKVVEWGGRVFQVRVHGARGFGPRRPKLLSFLMTFMM